MDVICLTDSKISSEFNPDNILEPDSIVSGLSVLSRIVTHGFLKYNVSSGTVPESVIKHKAFFSSLVKSKTP